MYSTTESVESSLDVVVHFTEEEWQKAKRDIAWTTSIVIEELRRYKSRPEEYFATRPFWAARILPWECRIKMEIIGHFWTNDRNIRFSEWWIVKLLR
ncbi:MAG TPA: hypothetical protein VLB04_06245 [Methanotrichaceae archaeon]|nr:hypothetical protein [Methanotrichaceae archaeon]